MAGVAWRSAILFVVAPDGSAFAVLSGGESGQSDGAVAADAVPCALLEFFLESVGSFVEAVRAAPRRHYRLIRRGHPLGRFTDGASGRWLAPLRDLGRLCLRFHGRPRRRISRSRWTLPSADAIDGRIDSRAAVASRSPRSKA